jgi:hypothetical protein
MRKGVVDRLINLNSMPHWEKEEILPLDPDSSLDLFQETRLEMIVLAQD